MGISGNVIQSRNNMLYVKMALQDWGDHSNIEYAYLACSNVFTFNLNSFTAGTTAYSSSYFGRGTGGIYLDNLGCRGSESRLIDCPHSRIGVHNCDHSDDAGMRCQRR